jgi:hypothetical protein
MLASVRMRLTGSKYTINSQSVPGGVYLRTGLLSIDGLLQEWVVEFLEVICDSDLTHHRG